MGTSGERQSPIAAADVLFGSVANTATTAAATLITIPAGRVFVGVVVVNCSVANVPTNAANGQSTGIVGFAGAGVIPTGANTFRVTAHAGPNSATGTTGSSGVTSVSLPLVVVAPAGNNVTVTFASTISSSGEAESNATCTGLLQ